MAIKFLGYLDSPDALSINGSRRCLFGCDDSSDVTDLPTTAGLTTDAGGKTAVPAPWSVALVPGGNVKVLDSTPEWVDL